MVIEERARTVTTAPAGTPMPPAAAREVRLPITGMPGASCVRRIERAGYGIGQEAPAGAADGADHAAETRAR